MALNPQLGRASTATFQRPVTYARPNYNTTPSYSSTGTGAVVGTDSYYEQGQGGIAPYVGRNLVGDTGSTSRTPGFITSVRRGGEQTQALLYGGAGAVGDLFGIDSLRDWGYEGYNRNMEQAAQFPRESWFLF